MDGETRTTFDGFTARVHCAGECYKHHAAVPRYMLRYSREPPWDFASGDEEARDILHLPRGEVTYQHHRVEEESDDYIIGKSRLRYPLSKRKKSEPLNF